MCLNFLPLSNYDYTSEASSFAASQVLPSEPPLVSGAAKGGGPRDSVYFPASATLSRSCLFRVLADARSLSHSAGETLGDGDAIDDNLFDAILLVSLKSRIVGGGLTITFVA